MTTQGWEDRATDWTAWARAPGHDSYWQFAREPFLALVPEPGAATLDVGCGEGRVARDLVERGHSVTGVDASPSLIEAAAHADPGSTYLVAPAEALPFAAAGFDLVVCHNVLMDVADMPQAVAEIARVLTPGGAAVIGVTHPLNDAGAFASDAPDAPFVIAGSYLESSRFDIHVETAGLRMHFDGPTYALSAYGDAFERSGLLIEALREPAPSDAGAAVRPEYRRWQRMPMFLHLRLRKPHAR